MREQKGVRPQASGVQAESDLKILDRVRVTIGSWAGQCEYVGTVVELGEGRWEGHYLVSGGPSNNDLWYKREYLVKVVEPKDLIGAPKGLNTSGIKHDEGKLPGELKKQSAVSSQRSAQEKITCTCGISVNCRAHELRGPSRTGLKHDADKLAVDLLPVRALQEVAKVLRFGAAKYQSDGWRTVKPRRIYFASAMRHLYDRALGVKVDPESGLPVLAHAACDVLFLLAYEVGFDPTDTFEEEASDLRYQEKNE